MTEKRDSEQPENEIELTTDYANNTLFEPTIWDLKLIFGEFSQRSKSIEYHTSITVPWAQAKLIMYYLQANVAVHESETGTIKIPKAVWPQEWVPPAEQAAKDPKNKQLYERLKKLRTELLEGSG